MSEEARALSRLKRTALLSAASRALHRARAALLDDAARDESNGAYALKFDVATRPLVDSSVDCLKAATKAGGTAQEERSLRAAVEAVQLLRDKVESRFESDSSGWNACELSPALHVPDACCAVVLPCAQNSGDGFSRVSQICGRVEALKSKTRPKKLRFECSDGSKRAFLLKGAEDVHMDARVMQLLQALNLALAKQSKTDARRHVPVQVYAVLPLSRSSGLIEWVPRTRPLFEHYRDAVASRAV